MSSHRFDNAVLPRRSLALPPLELSLVFEREKWAVYTVEDGKRDMWLGDFGLRAHAEAFIQMLYETEKR